MWRELGGRDVGSRSHRFSSYSVGARSLLSLYPGAASSTSSINRCCSYSSLHTIPPLFIPSSWAWSGCWKDPEPKSNSSCASQKLQESTTRRKKNIRQTCHHPSNRVVWLAVHFDGAHCPGPLKLLLPEADVQVRMPACLPRVSKSNLPGFGRRHNEYGSLGS